jgi:crotonobetainyl-CoA:carnitine CoA-transferase CaiB-like acyl-CoA transferase
MQRALEGIRILDLTSVVMGPLATQMLGDFGADVIKIESPQGDTTRRVGPMRHPLMGWVYLNLNRNKRSLVLDLKQGAALDAFKRLARQADVLVFSVRPAAMARLGVSYEALARENPRLIGVSLVGFGDGPYAGQPVYEDLIQGLTAIPNLLVRAGSQTPHYVPFSFNDRMVGTHAAMSIMVALFHRERTGQGQQIQVPMFETMAQHVLAEHGGGRSFAPPLGAPGYLRTLNKERRPYATRDGHVCVIIYTDKHWRDFFQLTGEAERYANDPRMKDIGVRTEHSDALYAIVSGHMQTRSTQEWLTALEGIDVPCAPLHTLDSLFEDRHLNQTGFLRTVEHPSEGALLEAGPAGTWSLSPPEVRRHAPRLGEHSAELLREAGLDEAEISQLAASGATQIAGVA